MDPDTGQPQSNHNAAKLKKFEFTDDGGIKTFVGVDTQRTPDGIHLL